jgi:hypothetical protein
MAMANAFADDVPIEIADSALGLHGPAVIEELAIPHAQHRILAARNAQASRHRRQPALPRQATARADPRVGRLHTGKLRRLAEIAFR